MPVTRFDFTAPSGHKLSARLHMPEQTPAHAALFAHCFTCSKDILAARIISQILSEHGFAVLRFDFTGLGMSEGEFSDTNFSSNIEDLIAANDALADHFRSPDLLIGHSLGGAAVLAAAEQLPDVTALVTIGAPADPAHIEHALGASVRQIEQDGEAEVLLAGRPFRVRQQFLDDIRHSSLNGHIARLKKALLVLHAPTDHTVGIENASHIFGAAKHPKSFIALHGADHLLSHKGDAQYAGRLIAAWAAHYLPE
ncbi:MAG: osmotically inducible protein OsmC [Robiginitomaculum sp.]|nr:MAG: osmotically inducible protein OsmC [Robiginitomaculum sp.]